MLAATEIGHIESFRPKRFAQRYGVDPLLTLVVVVTALYGLIRSLFRVWSKYFDGCSAGRSRSSWFGYYDCRFTSAARHSRPHYAIHFSRYLQCYWLLFC